MGHNYKTIPEDLADCADVIADYFKHYGYSLKFEVNELGFPFVPIMVCKRQQTRIILLVARKLNFNILENWVNYGKSCSADVRLAICLPFDSRINQDDEGKLKQKNIGLYIISTEQRVNEKIAPKDLAINVNLPEIKSLPRKIRPLLGSVYEQIYRSQWREGFEEACQVLEVEARKYLKNGSSNGRIRILSSGTVKTLKAKQINNLTMGQLAKKFSRIISPNHADSQITQALVKINKDRIGVAHKKKLSSTEKRLRKNVGQHMWMVIATLKYIHGLT